MRVLIQRVTRASVTIDATLVSSIESGMLALVGVTSSDTGLIAVQMAAKCTSLRIFDDDDGVMNRSLLDLVGSQKSAEMLAVSQFTLYADCRKGRRPSYTSAARPDVALAVFDTFVEETGKLGVPVRTGVFGAEMAVELVNDGPVTVWLDSDEFRWGM